MGEDRIQCRDRYNLAKEKSSQPLELREIKHVLKGSCIFFNKIYNEIFKKRMSILCLLILIILMKYKVKSVAEKDDSSDIEVTVC